MDIREIDVTQAQRLLESGNAVFVDVRDPHSFKALHVPGALHLDDSNVQAFVEAADKRATLVVYCYHGHSSLGATAYLQERGFSEVASLAGGFTAWQEDGAPQAYGVPERLVTD